MNRRSFLRRATVLGCGLGAGCHPAPHKASLEPEYLAETTAAALRDALATGRATCATLTNAHLRLIDMLDRRGPNLRAVIELNPDARTISENLDRETQAGCSRGPLHGLPVLVKDNLDTHDRMSTTAGSLALEGAIAPRDSFVVDRLRAAGLVILGKTNLSEWANFRGIRSTSGWSARGGQTRNPHCLDRNPSGSSSGSAAGVAAGYAPFAVGTETNGSIVSPASCCGIVGLKPTVGLVSRAGIIPISSSQDTAGPMARCVADAAALLAVMMGKDPRDPATERQSGFVDGHVSALLTPQPLTNARLGIARAHFSVHPLADPVFETALVTLRKLGFSLVDSIDLPSLAALDHADLTVMLYESKAGLNDYFANLGPGAPIRNIAELIAFNEREATREMCFFGQEHLLAAAAKGSLTDPAYLAAKARCDEWSRSLSRVFERDELDAIIAPTTGPAGPLDPISGDRQTGGCSTYAAVAGLPHLTIPCGEVFGLPVGLSFFGRAWSEPTLVSIALAFEQATRARPLPRFLPTIGSHFFDS